MIDFSFLELIVGLASLLIFIYRIIVIMYPMMKDAIKRGNHGDMLKSLTLLI
jgi:hypothetical protein